MNATLEKTATEKTLDEAESLSIDLTGQIQILHNILIAHHAGCEELDEDVLWGMQSILKDCLDKSGFIRDALIRRG
ncbi:hypothetical protein RIF25_09230 [Thermosynechococcaceae cyanobacterium BACA0444]|uniref:Uncharacterized protein n=1 Tax=Pseudocalidococcus azoricus BACA0444 TaxID=2918990 RepID=A0AAE4FRU4_9CYAN|nr:hypothetical protein [Pseudocalidococcus azoricus]MDS3860990.1 hypothetical protein [Pseudocalidococcus azoricus BACA0444]